MGLLWASVAAVALSAAGCKTQPSSSRPAGSASASISQPSSAAPSQTPPPGPSASANDSVAQAWVPWLEGLATRDGTRFGFATCFPDTKHCVQFPMSWKTDGRTEAMGEGKIAWGYPANRHSCLAVDRGGSQWEELIRRDESEQKGFSTPISLKVGTDEIPSKLRVKRLDMATVRPYPFNILMWFGCFGVDPVAAASPKGMPTGMANLLVLKLELKQGLTFNAYAFLSDSATEDEKKDLLATIRGIRAWPGKIATHPK